MNVFEFSERYKLSLAKARRIKKDHPQIFDEADSRFDAMRSTLSKGNRLTAPQLVQLVENPGNLLELGKHAAEATRQFAELGDAKGQAAPRLVVANLMEAAKGEPEAVQILADWMRKVIPSDPVEHAYLAVRLLLGLPENLRKSEGARIPRALLNARNHASLAGYFHVEKVASQKRTIYQKKGFDL